MTSEKPNPTPHAREFMAENAKSLVIEGRVNVRVGGAVYILENGKTFDLTSEDCRSMPYPKWKI